MLAIDRILAPTDFSPHAECAVRFACELAARFDAQLHLLHVLSDVAVPAGPDPMLIATMPPEYYREQEERSKQALERLVRDDWPRPREVVAEVRWGDPIDQIHGYAKDRQIDLVAIATHGRTGLAHVLLGSVAERIIREASCPVLTIRENSNR